MYKVLEGRERKGSSCEVSSILELFLKKKKKFAFFDIFNIDIKNLDSPIFIYWFFFFFNI